MATITQHTTRAAGTILTAAIYNADHVNHISNAQNLNNDKLEGATPPVVDGHAVLWDGTSGAAMKTAGFAPANAARLVSAGSGLTGGGNLTADRTLAADFASQAEAETPASATKVMSALRVRQWFDHANAKASQAEAEAVTVDTKWLSPLKWRQTFDHTNQKASQAEAEAGVNDAKWLSALKVKQAILALSPPGPVILTAVGTNSTVTNNTGGTVSGGTTTKTVTFSVARADTNYVVLGQWSSPNSEGGPSGHMLVTSKTVNGFTISPSGGTPFATAETWQFAVFDI